MKENMMLVKRTIDMLGHFDTDLNVFNLTHTETMHGLTDHEGGPEYAITNHGPTILTPAATNTSQADSMQDEQSVTATTSAALSSTSIPVKTRARKNSNNFLLLFFLYKNK